MKSVIVDFHSDYICPWCYIGKARLEKIIDKLKSEIEVIVHLKPHLLYPHIPKGGLPKSHFSQATKPGMGRSLKNEAVKEGIEINYKHIEIIPNSLEAHRMTWLIDDPQRKFAFSKIIFHGYFEKGKNIENHEYLADQAKASGASEKVIKSFLNTHQGREAIAHSIAATKEKFITLVPSIKLNGQILVPGLQEAEVWEKYIRRAATLSKNSN